MSSPKPSRFWRKCRIIFRRFRISVLSIILVLLACLLYLNQIGLPDFAKRRLQQELRERGLDFEFTRMRWRLGHGIVAENVRFGRTDGAANARFFAREAEMELDYAALAHLRLHVTGLKLRAGELSWELDVPEEPAARLSLEQIQAELRLLPGDLWQLNDFKAQFAGARFEFGGVITNASAIRDWKFFQSTGSRQPGLVEQRLHTLARTLDQIHFAAPPEFKLNVEGDARELQSFVVHLNVTAPNAETPWGTVQNAFLNLALLPDSSNATSRAELVLLAEDGQTPWAKGTDLSLKLNLHSSPRNADLIDAQMDLGIAHVSTRWAQADHAQLTARWQQSLTNAVPLSGEGGLALEEPRSQWANAHELVLAATFEQVPDALSQTDARWAWWTNLAPYELGWRCDLKGLQTTNLTASEVTSTGRWHTPEFTIYNFSSALFGGKVNGNARMDVSTRELNFNLSSSADLKSFAPFLPAAARSPMNEITWIQPPEIQLSGTIPLPAWTNLANVNWMREVRPASRFTGSFDLLSSAVRGMQFSSLRSHFSYSNQVWHLPDFVARRPEGELRLDHVSHEATRDFSFKLHSTLDPLFIKPLLNTNQQEIFDYLTFTQPPVIDGEIRGHWGELDSLGGRAHLAVTNFVVREEPMGDLVTTLQYTNRFLWILEPSAHRGTIEHATASGLGLDFDARKIYLTNAVGVADATAIVRAIGPHIARHMEPYHFLQPVAGRVDGTIPMHDPRDADLHFDVEGGPFEWWKFKVAHLKGRVDWVGDTLDLRHIESEFYGGAGTGDAHFDFSDYEHGTRFALNVVASKADLHLLMNDLSTATNRLEGSLTARLSITDANTDDLHTLQGSGRLNLRDGLIWEIPIFGILTPALDSISPGMGSTRANEGSATFSITNGVARSDDLEIRSAMMRLQYWGALDLANRTVNARVQAEPLRDVWAVGRIISFALWPVSKIFEYKISGTLETPKSEPVFFIPKVVLMPFHPIRTVKELLPEASPPTGTNAPPPLR